MKGLIDKKYNKLVDLIEEQGIGFMEVLERIENIQEGILIRYYNVELEEEEDYIKDGIVRVSMFACKVTSSFVLFHSEELPNKLNHVEKFSYNTSTFKNALSYIQRKVDKDKVDSIERFDKAENYEEAVSKLRNGRNGDVVYIVSGECYPKDLAIQLTEEVGLRGWLSK